jgi:uncharacterized protein YkwD
MRASVAAALAIAIVVVAAGRTGSAAPASPTAGVTSLEREAFGLVNRHRRDRGLPALVHDARIARQARLHSQAMAAGVRRVGHGGFDDRIEALRRVVTFRRIAENVALNRGARRPAASAVRGWIESPGHRRSMEGDYTATGVGVASNRAGEVYFTQIFVDR